MARQPPGPVSTAEAKGRLRAGGSYGDRLRTLRARRGPRSEPGAPSSLEEAKDRVRWAAARLSPPAWVGRHPYGAVVAALAGGMAAGGAPARLRRLVARGLLELALRRL
ncbi:MAG: hypothetical protein ACLFRB_03175 [Thiohalorhabdus sp.]|uniref:hypothetical protein n=1 Tax=Thiohalorhabdus sp. TaxID=3094134 RepID=UPI00397FBF50